MRQMRGSEPGTDVFRVVVTWRTPMDATFSLRCGRWSEPLRDLVPHTRLAQVRPATVVG